MTHARGKPKIRTVDAIIRTQRTALGGAGAGGSPPPNGGSAEGTPPDARDRGAPPRAGERPPSLDDVVARFGPALWRLTAAYAFAAADREDLHQEILIAVWRALPSYRGDASVRTFVYRIGHNRGLSFRARLDRAGRRLTELPPDLRDPAPLPDAALQRSRERERLIAAVATLATTLSQPLVLHLEGLSYGEIADVLGITANNVGVRLTRARSELARILGAAGGSP